MSSTNPSESRRHKLEKLQQLGVDPWGGRFDEHQPIGNIRGRESEITIVPAAEPSGDIAAARAGQRSAPEQHGPRVRAAGRIVLQRNKGKLIFIDIRDWTGQIQLYIGRNQVGEEDWAVAECFDLGDLIGVDGELKRTKTGELTIFVDKLHFLTKTLDPPPEKHHGLTDPGMRQRMRYLDLIHTDGVLERFLASHANRAVDPPARWPRQALSRSKAPRCTRSPAARRPGRSTRITMRSTCRFTCGSPWSCT